MIEAMAPKPKTLDLELQSLKHKKEKKNMISIECIQFHKKPRTINLPKLHLYSTKPYNIEIKKMHRKRWTLKPISESNLISIKCYWNRIFRSRIVLWNHDPRNGWWWRRSRIWRLLVSHAHSFGNNNKIFI